MDARPDDDRAHRPRDDGDQGRRSKPSTSRPRAPPFDGLGRLVPARAEAAEALDAELAKLSGLPVSAALDVTSRVVSEQAGMPSGTEPPPRPAEARQTITRRISNLVVRKGAAADDALFAIPADFHSRGLDRIVPEAP